MKFYPMPRKTLLLLLPVYAVLFMGADLASDVIAGRPTTPSLCMVKAADGRVYPCAGTDAGAFYSTSAPGPEGYRRTASGIVRMENLAAAGSIGYKLTATCYECEVFDEKANICYSLTCTDGGGIPMGTGSRRKICFDHTATGGADGGATQDVSGWSTSATSDFICTPES